MLGHPVVKYHLYLRRAEDPELDQKLVLRLQQLCQLEALLNLALNYAPSILQFPTCQGGLVSLPAVTSGPKVEHAWHADGACGHICEL